MMRKPAERVRRRWSLRRRLLAVGGAGAATAWIFGSAAMYAALSEESERLFDERLRSLADTVLAFAEHELAETELQRSRGDVVYVESALSMGSRYRFQIWSGSGELLLRSADAPASVPMSPLEARGLADTVSGGQALRTYTVGTREGNTVLQVGEMLAERQAVAWRLGAWLLGFLALSVVVVGGLGWLLLRRALQPIEISARELAARAPDELTPLPVAGAPRELVPLMQAVNELMQRVEITLSAERSFTAVAAHELRTPLASLRMQAQVAARERDTAARAAALATLVRGVDRLAHLVDQLLALARLDSVRSQDLPRADLDLRPLLEDAMADLGPLAAERDVGFAARLDAGRVSGVGFALSMLLRNLLANAFRHTPPGGRVEVSTRLDGDTVLLTVDDSGPGIPADQRSSVFERFAHARDVPSAGSGLGLSIVQSVARLHGTTVELSDAPLGGLRVQVRLPAAAAG